MTNLIIKRTGYLLLGVLVLFLALRPDQADAIAAFPGAEGGGAASLGGRGGVVIPVTNLNNTGAGSLRACVQASGPRTCVFRVGGTILVNSALTVTSPFLTIAGQTAPGGGIQLNGKNTTEPVIQILASDVVIRYIRVRHGSNSGCAGECGGNIAMGSGAVNQVVDHVSATWNQDENLGSSNSNTRSGTLSWNLIGEGVSTTTEAHNTSILFSGSTPAGSAALTNWDIHHNLTMNTNHRNPLLRNKTSRVVNNLWYNHKLYASHVSGGVVTDFIGNIYKRGPLNPNAAWHEFGALAGGQSFGKQAAGNPSVYLSGNIGWHQTNPAGDQWVMANSISSENGPDSGTVPTAWRRATAQANTAHPITAEAVSGLEASIVPIVGASRKLLCDGKWTANRDDHDKKMINEFLTNTGPNVHYTNESGYGGFPVIAGAGPGEPCPDTDNDGMPNAYEVIKGYNSAVADHNTVLGSGFTRLETFLSGETGVTPPPEGQKFQDDDRIFVSSSSVNVRATPGGTLLGTQAQNAQGVVTDGPQVTGNGGVWYNINFDSLTDGWVGETLIDLLVDSDTPPSVSVTAPAPSATVAGASVSVTASASDNLGVVGVQFELDGENLGSEDTTFPYGVIWNTTVVANGVHTLCAEARDAAGNTTTSAEVIVTVNNMAPGGGSGFNVGETAILGTNDTIAANVIQARAFTVPERGTIDSMTLYANTTAGLARMGIYDDDGTAGDPGTLLAETAGASVTGGYHTQAIVSPVTLNPGTYWLAILTNGAAVIKGTSTGATNKTNSHTYGALEDPYDVTATNTWRWTVYASFTAAPDTTGPAVSVTAPSTGNVSGAAVAMTATATDAVGVLGVTFHAASGTDGPTEANQIGAEDTTSTYGVTWDTTTYVNGPYNLYAVARDAAGNRTISAAVVVTVANTLAAPSGLVLIRNVP